MDIMNDEGGLTRFPLVLTLPEQGLFALGYYHQRADDRAAARASRELKMLVANPEADNASDDNGEE
jgi:CRISPR-associated protein Csd1